MKAQLSALICILMLMPSEGQLQDSGSLPDDPGTRTSVSDHQSDEINSRQGDAKFQAATDFQWPQGYGSAVVLTYDDGLDCHLDVAVPALDNYGFHGTFFCTGNSQSLYNRMDEWRGIVESGHELGNHSLFHPCDGERLEWVPDEYDLNRYSLKRIREELSAANSLLKAVDGHVDRTYGYTCSDYMAGGESFKNEVRELFIAARSDGPVPESMSDVDPWFAPSWGVNEPTGKELIEYVQQAEANGTIAVFMFHSVGGGYLNVSAEAHDELLRYLDNRRDEIWTENFRTVMSHVKKQLGK